MPSAGCPVSLNGSASSSESSATTSHTVSLPSGITSGELLVVIMTITGGGGIYASLPSGWTQQYGTDHSLFILSPTTYVYTKTAGPSEPSTLSITTSGSTVSCHSSYRFTGLFGDITAENKDYGDTTSSFTPSGDCGDMIFVAWAAYEGTSNSVTAYPLNFDYGQLDTNVTALNLGTAVTSPMTAVSTVEFSLTNSAEWGTQAFIIYCPDECPGGSDDLLADGISAEPEVGSPPIAQTHLLGGSGISAEPEVGSPPIAQTHPLGGGGIESSTETGTPTSGQTHLLNGGGIESTPEAGSPSAAETHSLSAGGISSEPEVDSGASLGQTHSLYAGGISSSPEYTGSSAGLGQTHALYAGGIYSEPEGTAPTASTTGADNLTARGISSTPEYVPPSFGQEHALYAGGIESASTTQMPAKIKTGPRRCCCAGCLIAEDDFNRAGPDPGTLWDGSATIVSNELVVTGLTSITRCHPAAAPDGSLWGRVTLVDPASNGPFSFRLGNPSGDIEVLIEFAGTMGVGTGTMTITVSGDGGSDSYIYDWENADEQVYFCYDPIVQASCGPTSRTSEAPDWVTICIDVPGARCWESNTKGNFHFLDGTFDDFRMEVHHREKTACPQCDCFCFQIIDGVETGWCIPPLIHITLETSCPSVSGTYEMHQLRALEVVYDAPPTLVAWPQKFQWVSDIISCPAANSDCMRFAFILECVKGDGTYPRFLLRLIRFGSCLSCSGLGFDPADPDTWIPSAQGDSYFDSQAYSTSASDCDPFILYFPNVIEDGYGCNIGDPSASSCCGGGIESGGIDGGGTTSDPVIMGVIITE